MHSDIISICLAFRVCILVLLFMNPIQIFLWIFFIFLNFFLSEYAMRQTWVCASIHSSFKAQAHKYILLIMETQFPLVPLPKKKKKIYACLPSLTTRTLAHLGCQPCRSMTRKSPRHENNATFFYNDGTTKEVLIGGPHVIPFTRHWCPDSEQIKTPQPQTYDFHREEKKKKEVMKSLYGA